MSDSEDTFEEANETMSGINLEEMMRRMEEMDKRLMEESRLRKEAEQRWLELKQSIENNNTTMHAASATTSIPPHSTMHMPERSVPQIKAPKIATPNKFDGVKGQKAEVFVNQVSLYMQMNASSFINEQAQVAFALSYMDGKASLWGQSLTDQLLDSEKMHLVTWNKFIESFKATFFDTERISKAEKEIRALYQTRSVSDYWIKFAELSLIVKWPQSVLISQFKQGLKGSIRVHMVRDVFEEVEEMAKLAIKIDNEVNERSQESTHQMSNIKTQTNTASDPNMMDCSAYRLNISGDEYRRRGVAGECYQCGKDDHLIGSCPEKKRFSNRRGRGRGYHSGFSRFKSRVAEVDVVKDEGSKAESSKNGDAQEC